MGALTDEGYNMDSELTMEDLKALRKRLKFDLEAVNTEIHARRLKGHIHGPECVTHEPRKEYPFCKAGFRLTVDEF